ncbi:MAG: hypothetical protein PF637_04550 [Spirochaetes bacterium]|jgi:hypothetical protein|nr:hypothetical protein [Spirochaetota bacterium]
MQKSKAILISLLASTTLFLISGFAVYKIYELNSLNSLRLALDTLERQNSIDTENFINSVYSAVNRRSFAEIQKKAESLLGKAPSQAKYSFIVLKNGTLIGHSSKTESERLSGNIAADEFAYNLDLILHPLKINLNSTFQSDYYIVDYKPPFSDNELRKLKHYTTHDIDKNGTLLSRRFQSSDRGEGVISIISTKKGVYTHIKEQLRKLSNIRYIIFGMSFLINTLLATILFIVLRGKQPALTSSSADIVRESALHPELTVAKPASYREPVFQTQQSSVQPVILDAIPIKKRGS